MSVKDILVVIENVLLDLDATLHQTYNRRFPADELPPIEHFFCAKEPLLSRKTRHKLFNMMLEDGFFEKLHVIKAAGDMLHEMYNYEQLYPQSIHVRICTSLNPAVHSVFFRGPSIEGEMWNYSYMDSAAMARILADKLVLLEKHLGVKQLWLSRLLILDEVQSDQDRRKLAFSEADVVIQSCLHCYRKMNLEQQQLLLLREKLNLSEELTQEAKHSNIIPFPKLNHWKKIMKLNVGLDDILEDIVEPEVVADSSESIVSFIHGSHNSSDIDRLYLFPDKLPNHKECLHFVQSSGTEDRNLFVVKYVKDKQGYVKECFKGIVDEVNNAFLTTYPLHKQDHPCPILGKINRVVPLKVCFTLLNLLIKTRHCTLYRDNVTKALRSFDFDTRRQIISGIDFTKLEASLNEDDIKYCAFRLGQTLALIEGKEVYTKDSVVEAYPKLGPSMYRDGRVSKSEQLQTLNVFTRLFLDAIADVKVDRKGSLHMFQMKRDKTPTNHFHLQANGLVVDMRDHKLICQYYPLNHKTDLKSDWPQDSVQVPDLSDDTTLISIFESVVEKKEPSKNKGKKKSKKDQKNKKQKDDESDDEEQTNSESSISTELVVCTNELFETAETKKVTKLMRSGDLNIDVGKLDFESYYHIFAYNKKRASLQLVAMRDKTTFLLSDPNIVSETQKHITKKR